VNLGEDLGWLSAVCRTERWRSGWDEGVQFIAGGLLTEVMGNYVGSLIQA